LSRQLYSLNQIAHALGDCDDGLLCEKVADAIRLGEEACDLQLSFSGRSPTTDFGPEAQKVDQELDRAIGAVAKHNKPARRNPIPLPCTLSSFGGPTVDSWA